MQVKTGNKVLIGSILVALLWLFGYGFVSAIIDSMEGQNLIGYAMKCQCMEPVSNFGYQLYYELFTDLPKKRDEMKESLDELGDDDDE